MKLAHEDRISAEIRGPSGRLGLQCLSASFGTFYNIPNRELRTRCTLFSGAVGKTTLCRLLLSLRQPQLREKVVAATKATAGNIFRILCKDASSRTVDLVLRVQNGELLVLRNDVLLPLCEDLNLLYLNVASDVSFSPSSLPESAAWISRYAEKFQLSLPDFQAIVNFPPKGGYPFGLLALKIEEDDLLAKFPSHADYFLSYSTLSGPFPFFRDVWSRTIQIV